MRKSPGLDRFNHQEDTKRDKPLDWMKIEKFDRYKHLLCERLNTFDEWLTRQRRRKQVMIQLVWKNRCRVNDQFFNKTLPYINPSLLSNRKRRNFHNPWEVYSPPNYDGQLALLMEMQTSRILLCLLDKKVITRKLVNDTAVRIYLEVIEASSSETPSGFFERIFQ